jgi:hypothetical protein
MDNHYKSFLKVILAQVFKHLAKNNFFGITAMKLPSKESIALSAQLECILDAFLSPPKRF